MKKLICLILALSIISIYNLNYFDEVKDFISQKLINEKINENNILDTSKIKKFEYIKIGDSKELVIDYIGSPDRIDSSEYDFSWYVYNSYKESFAMVGIENDIVVALFSNNINSCEGEEIYINKDIYYIRENFETLDYRDKGSVKYKITSNDEYDIIYKNNKYITVFYDKFEDDKIWAYEIIEKSTEDKNMGIYPSENKNIEESYMYQIIDLINSTRYKNNLNPLKYNEKASKSAKKHSQDMKENNYFNHTNLNDKTPFDRMENEGINYRTAGENIAAGQINAIYEHNGLMNSAGHRKNILGNYKYIGVGVIFGGKYKTYYTENFFG